MKYNENDTLDVLTRRLSLAAAEEKGGGSDSSLPGGRGDPKENREASYDPCTDHGHGRYGAYGACHQGLRFRRRGDLHAGWDALSCDRTWREAFRGAAFPV